MCISSSSIFKHTYIPILLHCNVLFCIVLLGADHTKNTWKDTLTCSEDDEMFGHFHVCGLFLKKHLKKSANNFIDTTKQQVHNLSSQTTNTGGVKVVSLQWSNTSLFIHSDNEDTCSLMWSVSFQKLAFCWRVWTCVDQILVKIAKANESNRAGSRDYCLIQWIQTIHFTSLIKSEGRYDQQ